MVGSNRVSKICVAMINDDEPAAAQSFWNTSPIAKLVGCKRRVRGPASAAVPAVRRRAIPSPAALTRYPTNKFRLAGRCQRMRYGPLRLGKDQCSNQPTRNIFVCERPRNAALRPKHPLQTSPLSITIWPTATLNDFRRTLPHVQATIHELAQCSAANDEFDYGWRFDAVWLRSPSQVRDLCRLNSARHRGRLWPAPFLSPRPQR